MIIKSGNPNTVHGVNPNLICADELMSQSETQLKVLQILEASSALNRSVIKLFISNCPESSSHPSLEMLKKYKRNPLWTVNEFKIDDRYNWKNKEAWMAHPFYKRSQVVRDNFEADFKEALLSKEKEKNFRMYHLGQGFKCNEFSFIDPEDGLKWISKSKERDKILKDNTIKWHCGWDLSCQGQDLSAFCLTGRRELSDFEDPLTDRRLYLIGSLYCSKKGLSKKPNFLRDKIYKFASDGEVTIQNTDTIEAGPIIEDFDDLVSKYPNIKEGLINVFDPAFSREYRRKLGQLGYKSITRTYSPRELSGSVRMFQRYSQKGLISILDRPSNCIKWMASVTQVNLSSRGYCLLDRLNKNHNYNIDFFSSAILGLSQCMQPRRLHIARAI